MSDAFATEEMSAALNDATNQANSSQAESGNQQGSSLANLEAAQIAREHGWTQPQQYDYNAYNAAGADREAVETTLPAWAHNAEKYEWREEYGEVGPRNEQLEHQLFRSEFLNRRGTRFDQLREIKVVAETTNHPAPIADFHDAGLHPAMVDNIDLCGYEVPTPVQAYTIPAVLTGNDVIAVAQTGSGKTAAYLIPALSKLMGKAKKLAAPRPSLANGFDPTVDAVRAEPLVLIIAPTRELATQIFDEARRLCYRSMLRPCVVYGGGPVREQRAELQQGCDVLIGTPGRLLDFTSKPHVLSLSRVKYIILDEADEMLQADWETEISAILSSKDTSEDANVRYMMFSATFNKGCRALARKFLANDHVRIRIGRAGSAHQNAKQVVVWCDESAKKQCLYDLLLSMPPSRTLVFVNSKRNADFLDDYLYNMGMPSTSIHSDRTQREREDALRAFRTAKSPILIATGVSARGLDIKNVMHVVNFDLPSVEHGGIDEYIHRIGRTARIGNEGLATSLFTEKDQSLGEDLVKVMLECDQPIPEFLESYKPEGEVTFHDDTDDEGEGGTGDTTGSGWGATNDTTNGGDGWGTTDSAVTNNGADAGSGWTSTPLTTGSEEW